MPVAPCENFYSSGEFEKKNCGGAMDYRRRMCNFTFKPINPKDRASVQLLLVKLDEQGRMLEELDIIDVCGEIRAAGQIDRLLTEYSRAN